MRSEGAVVISGTETAAELKGSLKTQVEELQKKDPSFKPGLVIVQVGGREDSNVYIRMKIKAAEQIGISASCLKLDRSTTQTQLLNKIRELNEDTSVHGIIVQMPLDTTEEIDSHLVTDAVSAAKDVDGLNTTNEGKVATGDLATGFLPCTPHGCLSLIQKSGVKIDESTAVVLGRSKIVGTPMAELLKWHHATVTVCHSRTKNLEAVCRTADILVVAVGRAEMVKKDWVKPGAVVIDCGINSVEDSTKKSGYRLVGDVAYGEVAQVAGYITPVPGGVGPMTVAMLMHNTVQSAVTAYNKAQNAAWSLSLLKLEPLAKVPSDIEVARAQTPKDVDLLAAEIGLLSSEVDLYGKKKAKVSLKTLDRLASRRNGKYVCVAGITPTPLGEGKSTTTIGLCQALGSQLKRNVFACVRQPSQGPTFGIKGGAAGGG